MLQSNQLRDTELGLVGEVKLSNQVPDGHKACRYCKQVKPLTEFYKNKTFKSGRDIKCRTCYRTRRDWKLDSIRMRYGISAEQFRETLEKQDNRCNICHTPFEKPADICIDHCHDTMRFRGLLCRKCNSALGLLGENTVNLQRAIKHIEEPKDSAKVIFVDSERLLKRRKHPSLL